MKDQTKVFKQLKIYTYHLYNPKNKCHQVIFFLKFKPSFFLKMEHNHD